MNAPVKASYLARQFTERCQFDDNLTLDLIGECDEENGYVVETVKPAGCDADITVLFSNRQLENLGKWLDLKDGHEDQRRWAWIHLSQAQSHG